MNMKMDGKISISKNNMSSAGFRMFFTVIRGCLLVILGFWREFGIIVYSQKKTLPA
jgi:hypothetical protein